MSKESNNLERGYVYPSDFVVLPDGRKVFTASYLKRRGHCCKNGCKNCPYGYKL